jgi:hypothetical protein
MNGELRLLMDLLEQLDIRLVSRYIYPQQAQSSRLLFTDDRPRRVDAVVLRSVYAHVASASVDSQKYLARCLRLSTVKSDISLRLQTLHSRDIDTGWTIAQMDQRSRLTEPAVDFVARRHLQTPRGSPSSCAYRTNVAFPNVVTISSRPRRVSCRSATAKVQCLVFTHGEPF